MDRTFLMQFPFFLIPSGSESCFATDSNKASYLMALGTIDDMPNSYNYLIPDLKSHCSILFKDQAEDDNSLYAEFVRKLDELNKKAGKLREYDGGLNNQSKIDEYRKCATEELKKVLEDYIPLLLKNESYFSSVFY